MTDPTPPTAGRDEATIARASNQEVVRDQMIRDLLGIAFSGRPGSAWADLRAAVRVGFIGPDEARPIAEATAREVADGVAHSMALSGKPVSDDVVTRMVARSTASLMADLTG